jgi:biopolymer transport protein ExbD
MAAKTDQSDEIADINIVPLVDIILVVLIIFMVTAPALVKPSVKVNLPEASSGDQTTATPFTVAITSDGEISVNGESVDEDKLKQLAAAEAEKNPELQALIGADRDVSHGTVIKVLDWIKSSGIKKFSLTTDGPTK